jgi:hypothetical protein
MQKSREALLGEVESKSRSMSGISHAAQERMQNKLKNA